MKNKTSLTLSQVDRVIAIAYVFMLIPIGFGLTKIPADALLGYFADILAVVAALYAGRAVFLSVAPVVDTRGDEMAKPASGNREDAASDSAGNDRRNGATRASKGPGEYREAGTATIPVSTKESTSQPETPQKSFWVMMGFLVVYTGIKAVLLLKDIYRFENWLIAALLIVGGISFGCFAYIEFQKDKKMPYWRPLLAVLFFFSSIVIAIALISRS
jgi:hypothetical protein